MVQTEKIESERTDVAALSAGAIAVAVTLLLGPGEWGIMNVAVSFTLLCIILGYVWNHQRSFGQSMAVATSIGLVSFPGIAFFVEAALFNDHIGFLIGEYDWDCSKNPCDGSEHMSRVHNSWLFLIWFSISALVLVADLFKRNRK